MNPRLFIVGLGPGKPDQMTPEAHQALAEATDVLGYGPYVARTALSTDVVRHATDNREELERASHALGLAISGRVPVVVSGGDAGVFGMASAVFEAIESGPASWRKIDIQVVPGVTAVLAAAARLGAPLGGDFCVLSLSDNLKPWDLVERRLCLAASAGLVMALYNPRSASRPHQLDRAFDVLRAILAPETLIVFARAIGRDGEKVQVMPLSEANGSYADMSTLILIGCAETRQIDRPGDTPWIYTRRRVS